MITVVIPTHNRSDDLLRAVQSIFNQTILPSEIIVIDDASNPPVNLKDLPKTPENINLKILRNTISKGANFSRNLGVQSTCAEWISFLDDDDLFLSSKIKIIKDTIQNNSHKVDVIYHPALICLVNEGIEYVSQPKIFKSDDNIFKSLLIKNQIGGTSMVTIKRKKLIEVGLFDINLPALQDYELWLRLARNNAKFLYINLPLTKYQYVTSRKNISKNLIANSDARQYILKKYKDEYLKLKNSEKKANDEYYIRGQIRRFILNKQNLKAAKYCFNAFIKYKRLNYLIFMCVSFLGIRGVYGLRRDISPKSIEKS